MSRNDLSGRLERFNQNNGSKKKSTWIHLKKISSNWVANHGTKGKDLRYGRIKNDWWWVNPLLIKIRSHSMINFPNPKGSSSNKCFSTLFPGSLHNWYELSPGHSFFITEVIGNSNGEAPELVTVSENFGFLGTGAEGSRVTDNTSGRTSNFSWNSLPTASNGVEVVGRPWIMTQEAGSMCARGRDWWEFWIWITCESNVCFRVRSLANPFGSKVVVVVKQLIKFWRQKLTISIVTKTSSR